MRERATRPSVEVDWLLFVVAVDVVPVGKVGEVD